jgi:hypothetical protein
MKCLFLRIRDPSVEILDNFVITITREHLHNNMSQEFLDCVRKSFTDYRNKFNDNIQRIISDFRSMDRGSSLPTSNEIKEIITEEVVKKVLSRQLAAVNQYMLKQNGGLDKLIDFVRESFRISWEGKNLSTIKSLDHMTKDLKIPSRSGRNICDKLTVSYLLFFY